MVVVLHPQLQSTSFRSTMTFNRFKMIQPLTFGTSCHRSGLIWVLPCSYWSHLDVGWVNCWLLSFILFDFKMIFRACVLSLNPSCEIYYEFWVISCDLGIYRYFRRISLVVKHEDWGPWTVSQKPSTATGEQSGSFKLCVGGCNIWEERCV